MSSWTLRAVNELIARVTVEVKGRETEGVDVQTKPLHKKDAAIGNKQLVYSSNLIMEQEDAASFGDNEEVYFLFFENPGHG